MSTATTTPTEAEVLAAFDEQQEWSCAYGRTKRSAPGFATVAANFYRTRDELYRLQDACTHALATSRGWRIYKSQITVEQLTTGRMVNRYRGERDPDGHIIDHAEYFMCQRKPVAILTHSYAPIESCLEFARQRGLTAELLPFSWYFPGRSVAVLFTKQTTPGALA